jgi:hypothetical protein
MFGLINKYEKMILAFNTLGARTREKNKIPIRNYFYSRIVERNFCANLWMGTKGDR